MEHLLHVRDMLNIHMLSHLSPLQQSYMVNTIILPVLLVRKLREVIHWWSQNR